MVAGDLVNTASRLQSVAPPGAVLVGEATQRAAAKSIAFEPAGDQVLKGKTAPVPAFRALRVVAEMGGRNRSEALEAPFVGRDEELRLLKDLFHATGRDRRARLVSVVGPAGIGKTRLAWEFLKYVDGLVEDTYWHSGRSPAYGEGITFWALGEMVRGRCRLLETDDDATTRAKVAEAVRDWVPDEEEQRWVEPGLLALLGSGEATAGGRDELFAAWRTFFERIASHGTVAMVFEDLHWADAGLLDFIDHLLEWSKSLPLYIVTLARPELLDRRPDWGAGKRNFTSLSLEPLPETAMRALLAGLVPGLPESAVRAIVARADGVPLYAVETVRMLVAEGRLAEEDGVYRPIGDLANLAVPETLHALIASRLDALEPADRGLLQDASVLGQSFTPAALSAVNGLDIAELEPRLRGLARREFLVHEADSRSPERGQYAFVQALIREVAYNTLARADRKVRHLAAARWFEALGDDELAGALAGQYLAAYRSAAEGPEADALAGQARLALKGAAERAAALGSHEQALSLVRQALTVTLDAAEEAELLERAGDSASAAGHHEEAVSLLGRAVDLGQVRGDRHAVARATASLSRAMLYGRQTEGARVLLEAAATEFADLEADPGVIALMGQLARAHLFEGEWERAIVVADRVLEAAEHADLVPVIADTLVTKGSSLCNRRRYHEGIGLIGIGGELAEAHHLHSTSLRALLNRAGNQAELDPGAALATDRSGLELARRLGVRTMVISFVAGAADAAIRAGDWEWAVRELDTELEGEVEPFDRATLLYSAIPYRAYRGESVSQLVAEFDQLTEHSTDPTIRTQPFDLRACIALAEGRLGDARDQALTSNAMLPFLRALELAARAAFWLRDLEAARADVAAFEATGAHGPAFEASRATLRAGLAALEGRRADAQALYRDALRAWRHLDLPWDEALTGMDMVAVLGPDDPDAQQPASRLAASWNGSAPRRSWSGSSRRWQRPPSHRPGRRWAKGPIAVRKVRRRPSARVLCPLHGGSEGPLHRLNEARVQGQGDGGAFAAVLAGDADGQRPAVPAERVEAAAWDRQEVDPVPASLEILVRFGRDDELSGGKDGDARGGARSASAGLDDVAYSDSHGFARVGAHRRRLQHERPLVRQADRALPRSMTIEPQEPALGRHSSGGDPASKPVEVGSQRLSLCRVVPHDELVRRGDEAQPAVEEDPAVVDRQQPVDGDRDQPTLRAVVDPKRDDVVAKPEDLRRRDDATPGCGQARGAWDDEEAIERQRPAGRLQGRQGRRRHFPSVRRSERTTRKPRRVEPGDRDLPWLGRVGDGRPEAADQPAPERRSSRGRRRLGARCDLVRGEIPVAQHAR